MTCFLSFPPSPPPPLPFSFSFWLYDLQSRKDFLWIVDSFMFCRCGVTQSKSQRYHSEHSVPCQAVQYEASLTFMAGNECMKKFAPSKNKRKTIKRVFPRLSTYRVLLLDSTRAYFVFSREISAPTPFLIAMSKKEKYEIL